MGGHHLVLGTLQDYLTGETLEDTLDERYRQKIARRLVEACGFGPSEIEPRHAILLKADERRAVIRVDFIVRLDGRAAMIVRFGPGSLVSRERPALAIARTVAPAPVPVAVVTNGEDAEVLDVASGKVIGRGLDAIPRRPELHRVLAGWNAAPVSDDRRERELRIAYCYEVDGACPCDDSICRIT
jgi:hypothetical protein